VFDLTTLARAKGWHQTQDAFASHFGLFIAVVSEEGKILATSGKRPFLAEIIWNKKKQEIQKELLEQYRLISAQKPSLFWRGQSGLLYILQSLEKDGKQKGMLVVGCLRDREQVPPNAAALTQELQMEENDFLGEYEKIPILNTDQLSALQTTTKALASLFFPLTEEEIKAKQKINSLSLYQNLNGLFGASGNVEHLMKTALRFLFRTYHLDGCSIFLFLDEQTQYRQGIPEHQVYDKIEQIITQQVINSKTFVRVSDIKNDYMLGQLQSVEKIDLSICSFPFFMEKKVVGIMHLYGPSKRSFSDEEFLQLELFSQELMVAILRQRNLKKVRETAIIDKLTQLYNRRFFHENFEKHIEHAQAQKHPISLLIFDVDDFKVINDTYGHVEGDKVLQDVSKLLTKTIRASDVACRYGGEEFVVIIPGISPNDARGLAERIRKSIEEYPFDYLEKDKRITVSIGLITCLNSTMGGGEMLKESDKNLYEAKRKGKNMVISSIQVDRGLAPINVDEVKRHHSKS